jgi:4-aminobutyrate aminotransferase-like enzyme/Ser/Thr protein kinase RdoA (MazF antagonist)
MREGTRPHPLSLEDARSLASSLYGIDAAPREVPSYIDQNFQLKTADGRSFVLKIANAEESRGILDLQNAAMDWVAARTHPGFCQQVQPTLGGERITETKGPDGSTRLVRLLTWIPGDLLADCAPHDHALLASLGRFLGTMTRALTGFEHPAAERELDWDLGRAAWIGEFTHEIEHGARREIVEQVLDLFRSRVVPAMPDLRRSVIHNDGNDYNVLVDRHSSAGPQVCGILDFGDMTRTHTIFELAIAIAYAILGKMDPLAAAALVASGFHEVFPLTEIETDLLHDLVRMRLCVSVTKSALQAKVDPDNEYVKISERPAWIALEQLASIEPEAARATYRRACKMPKRLPADGRGGPPLLDERRRYLGSALSIAYEKPLEIVRGSFQYLFDNEGRVYLDAVNNVCHVGHCHPRVVEAGQQQMAALNTNTRYLHHNLVDFARRLASTMPDPLEVCFLVCTGSEANDLALRMARAHTGRRDIIVLEGAYHGNTASLIDVSPYKFDGPGGAGAPPHVHKVPLPDAYRGPHRGMDRAVGETYAKYVADAISGLRRSEREPAAFLCESLPGCAGQIVLPPGYLDSAFKHVRAAGGICIADEVQVGFGRVGECFWGFETQGVVPDIVTLGKPIGNGHPLAAVLTTPEIAASFDTGMEYFNTFGGNPVSCAIGMAVLDVIEEEGLQENALRVGEHLKGALRRIADRHPLIGDVRGLGLFIGIELVRDRNTLEPAAEEATQIIERMRDRGILLSIDGPLYNVLKIKPPICLTEEDADHLVGTLDDVLGDL